MPKLPSLTGRDVIVAFERLGFLLDRIEGSHHVLKKPGHRYLLSVPVHSGRAVKRGTLRRLRDAGTTEEQFAALLG